MSNTTIWIKQTTKSKLESLKEKNETFDQAIGRLMARAKKNPIDLRLSWYRQSVQATPFFSSLAYKSWMQMYDDRKMFSIYQGTKNHGYWSTKDASEMAKKVIEEQMKDTKYLKKSLVFWEEIVQNQIGVEKKIKDLDKKDIQQLENLLRVFIKWVLKAWKKALVIELFDAEGEDLIIETLDKFKKNSLTIQEFKVLASPEIMSLIQNEHYDFCKLALINEPSNIKEHAKKYYFIKNTWAATKYLGPDYFRDKLRRMKEEGTHFDEEIKRIESIQSQLKDEKSKIMIEKKPSKNTMKLVNLVREMSEWRERRKKYTLITNHFLSLFLDAFSRKLKIRRDLLEFAMPWELLDWRQLKIRDLEKRKENLILYSEGDQMHALCGEEARHLIEEINGSMSEKKQRYYGKVANTGKVLGQAKVVFAVEDMGKVGENDIMVAPSTRPEYLPAMKLAAAIITDEGGITSHAAIVSRELNKPCIVGLQNASDTIEDGDELLVNANHGTVDIVKN